MTKVIKTTVKASTIVPLDASGNPALKQLDMPKPLIDQFNNNDELIESFLPVVENTNVSTHIYDILNDKYGIVSRDKGLAIDTLNRWVASKIAFLNDTDIDILQNADTKAMYFLADRIIQSLISEREARTGILLGTPKFNLNLIGESTHAKASRNR